MAHAYRTDRREALAVLGLVASVALAGCLRFHLFQVDLPSDMQHQNERNLAKLPTDRPPISKDHPLVFAFVSEGQAANALGRRHHQHAAEGTIGKTIFDGKPASAFGIFARRHRFAPHGARQ